MVLLKNRNRCLPLKKGLKLYIPRRHIRESLGFMRWKQPARDIDPVTEPLISRYGTRVETPEEADAAIVFVESEELGVRSEK